MDLDDHSEGVLHLRLGLLSLSRSVGVSLTRPGPFLMPRLALDAVVELVEGGQVDQEELLVLPSRLREAVCRRQEGQGGQAEEGEETQYCRERLRAGI